MSRWLVPILIALILAGAICAGIYVPVALMRGQESQLLGQVQVNRADAYRSELDAMTGSISFNKKLMLLYGLWPSEVSSRTATITTDSIGLENTLMGIEILSQLMDSNYRVKPDSLQAAERLWMLIKESGAQAMQQTTYTDSALSKYTLDVQTVSWDYSTVLAGTASASGSYEFVTQASVTISLDQASGSLIGITVQYDLEGGPGETQASEYYQQILPDLMQMQRTNMADCISALGFESAGVLTAGEAAALHGSYPPGLPSVTLENPLIFLVSDPASRETFFFATYQSVSGWSAFFIPQK